LASTAEKVVINCSFFKYHTLEDIAGMTHDNIISFGEGAEVIGDLLQNRYPNVIPFNDVDEYFRKNSFNNRDYFNSWYDFGKALEKLVWFKEKIKMAKGGHPNPLDFLNGYLSPQPPRNPDNIESYSSSIRSHRSTHMSLAS